MWGAAYVLAPALLVLAARGKSPATWLDYLAVLAVWFPVELRWLYKLLPYPPPLTHTLTILLALNTGLAAFLFIRRLDKIGYTLEWGRGFGRVVGVSLALIAIIIIPLGMKMGFLTFAPSLARLRSLPLAALGITLFTAWPEEFLFRGLLQNLLSRTLGGPWAGLLVASAIFGCAHLNNGGFPNWRYAILATIAGFFYGRAWMKTGSLLPSAMIHATVDVLWHVLFR
jgi:membrane protease YdiL (CAAX protease family)